MNFPFNFIVIPAITIWLAVSGSRQTKQGLMPWFKDLKKPHQVPSGKLIKEIWFFLYIITAGAVMWFWNVPAFGWFQLIVGLVLLANVYYHYTWKKIFFIQHDLAKATNASKLLFFTGVLATVLMIEPSPIAAFLMLPYLIWLLLIYRFMREVYQLNKS